MGLWYFFGVIVGAVVFSIGLVTDDAVNMVIGMICFALNFLALQMEFE